MGRPVAVVCLAFSSFKVSDLSHFSYPVSILLSVLFSVVPIFVFVCFSSFPRLSFAWVFWLKLETTVFASSFFLSLYFFRTLFRKLCLSLFLLLCQLGGISTSCVLCIFYFHHFILLWILFLHLLPPMLFWKYIFVLMFLT